MFSTTDTIVAIATPPGRGALGVVRLSGPAAETIVRRLSSRTDPFEPRHATLTTIRAVDGTAIDQVVVTCFSAPASYTGEHVAEISAHGSPVVLQTIVAAVLAAGARLAAPGEFTLRAFLNSRIDLAQAEAIGDLINAATPHQARAAFDQLSGTLTQAIAEIDRALFDLAARLEASVDFPDEGYHFVEPSALVLELDAIANRLEALITSARRGRLLREGRQVVIAGAPNAGKSSLFNALVGVDRAIVTEVPGTTRDLVTEAVDIGGVRITLVDTAGLRSTDDRVEAEGVGRSKRAIDVADLILIVADRSQPKSNLPEHILSVSDSIKKTYVATKGDLLPAWTDPHWLTVSSVSGEGLADLRRQISGGLDDELMADAPAVTNVRHLALVERAKESVVRARDAAGENGQVLSEEFLLADLQQARIALEEVTGKRTTEDLLIHIFEHFCIGK